MAASPTSPPQPIVLLGSTGSIGTQTLNVIARFPERFKIVALAAGDNLVRLAEQTTRFAPEVVSIRDPTRIAEFAALVPDYHGTILAGPEALDTLATWEPALQPALPNTACTLVVGLVGMRGLAPTLAALKAGRRVLTANKETFVAGGHLVTPYMAEDSARIIPIDSEHSAIHQCLGTADPKSVETLYLTASGGPFRDYRPEQLADVTLAEALRHPNWSMGPKITIDSATMMNKGLEIIEAHWLFNMPYERIQVVLHPQSIIHSGVAFVDGSILVQMGAPDMHGPIMYAMGYPDRLTAIPEQPRLNLLDCPSLDFRAADADLFPCLALAVEAGTLGSGATAVLNAADEAAVALFLEERIRFVEIPKILSRVLDAYRGSSSTPNPVPTLDEVLALDAWSRAQVTEQLAKSH